MFEYNQYGVCKNPEKVVLISDHDCRIVIYLASYNGVWGYGKDVQIGKPTVGYGFSSGVQKGRLNYKSREEALTAAEREILHIVRRKGGCKRTAAEKVVQVIMENQQLSLFG